MNECCIGDPGSFTFNMISASPNARFSYQLVGEERLHKSRQLESLTSASNHEYSYRLEPNEGRVVDPSAASADSAHTADGSDYLSVMLVAQVFDASRRLNSVNCLCALLTSNFCQQKRQEIKSEFVFVKTKRSRRLPISERASPACLRGSLVLFRERVHQLARQSEFLHSSRLRPQADPTAAADLLLRRVQRLLLTRRRQLQSDVS